MHQFHTKFLEIDVIFPMWARRQILFFIFFSPTKEQKPVEIDLEQYTECHLIYYLAVASFFCCFLLVISGVEITKYFSLSSGKVLKTFTCPALFLPVLDIQTDSDFQNFSLSFGKVSNIFTCQALFLPVPDRWTACNFHPCIYLQGV